MSTDTASELADVTETFGSTWLFGALAGVVAGAAMAVYLVLLSPATIAVAIPRLYGLSGMVTGWAVHLTHGAAFGAAFAALALGTDSRPVAALLGVAYGVALWFVAAGTLMPIWLTSVGFPAAPPVPNLDPVVLGAHLVYGVVIGGLFPLLVDG